MINITRSQLDHKLEEYRQHNQDMKKTIELIFKAVLVATIIEIALGFIVLGGFTLRAFVFDIVILLLNFALIMIIPMYKSLKYEFAGTISLRTFINSLILQFKYKDIVKDSGSFADSNALIAKINNALSKEKNNYNILSLLEFKMSAYLRESDFENAEKIFNEICSSKQHPGFSLEETKLAYYGVIEDNDNYMRQYEANQEILKKWSRSNLKYSLHFLMHNSIYLQLKGEYEDALNIQKLQIEYSEKKLQYDYSETISRSDMYNKSAQNSTLARIYLKLNDYNSAREAVTDAERIFEEADFRIPQILIDEIAETKEKLSKCSADVD